MRTHIPTHQPPHTSPHQHPHSTASDIPTTTNNENNNNEPGLLKWTELTIKHLGRAAYDVGAPIVQGVAAVRNALGNLLARPNALAAIFSPGIMRYSGA